MLTQEQRPPADGALGLDVIPLDLDHSRPDFDSRPAAVSIPKSGESRRKPAGSQNWPDTRFVPAETFAGTVYRQHVGTGEERLGRGCMVAAATLIGAGMIGAALPGHAAPTAQTSTVMRQLDALTGRRARLTAAVVTRQAQVDAFAAAVLAGELRIKRDRAAQARVRSRLAALLVAQYKGPSSDPDRVPAGSGIARRTDLARRHARPDLGIPSCGDRTAHRRRPQGADAEEARTSASPQGVDPADRTHRHPRPDRSGHHRPPAAARPADRGHPRRGAPRAAPGEPPWRPTPAAANDTAHSGGRLRARASRAKSPGTAPDSPDSPRRRARSSTPASSPPPARGWRSARWCRSPAPSPIAA